MKKRFVVARWCIALTMLWACCLGLTQRTLAADRDGPRTVWDFADPVNVAETRAYAALWFEYKDTGVISEELTNFRFTNRFPFASTSIFHATELLFEQLYAHRLDPFIDSPTHYTLDDLRRDDPDVEAAFRLHATTGNVSTDLTDDEELLKSHLEGIADAMGAATQFVLAPDGRAAVTDGALESFGLMILDSTGDSDESSPSVGTGGDNAVVAAIKKKLPWTPIPGQSPPYWPDNKVPCTTDPSGWCDAPGQPGFDCDDWARAWAAWLKKHLTQYPDAEYFILTFDWGTGEGHAVVLIKINGKYYIVDPQSGAVYGPIDPGGWFTNPKFEPWLRKLLQDHYGVPNPGKIRWWKHPPDWNHPDDPAPWHTDPDVVDWWKRQFPGLDPNDFIWSGVVSGD